MSTHEDSLNTTNVCLTVHNLTNLPKTMQQIDPSRTEFQIHVTGIVRYLAEGEQHDVIASNSGAAGAKELAPLGMMFLPSSIMFRKDKFSVDIDTRPNIAPDQLTAKSTIQWVISEGSSGTAPVLEVFVGIKEKKQGSSACRWVPSSQTPTLRQQQGYRFAIPLETIVRSKMITRVVGFTLGQVTLSLYISPSDPGYRGRVKAFVAQHPQIRLDTEKMIQSANEVETFSMLFAAAGVMDYKARIEKFLAVSAPDVVPAVPELLKEWKGREEFLIRWLVMEHGPEPDTIPFRYRIGGFMRKYKLSEQDVVAVLGEVPKDNSGMSKLISKYGNEMPPRTYLFPTPTYEPDLRSTMADFLAFPVNKPGVKNWRDLALQARQRRKCLINTPGEREVNKMSRTQKPLSEIEILQEKHEPEFRQIIPAVAEALSAVVAQHTELAAKVVATPGVEDPFACYETSNLPGIQLEDYVHRIAEYTYISPASMVVALIFIDRMCEKHSNLLITKSKVFKLFIVAVRVASKVIDLRTLNNKNFAGVGGVSNKNLNDLEEKFLKHLRFDLFLSPAEFFEYAKRLNPPAHTHSSIPRTPQHQQSE